LETPLDLGSEAHLRSILDTVPDAMVVIDDHGRIISFSTAAEAMFGYASAEIIGENVSTLMPSPDRERHDMYLDRYNATGRRKIIGIGRITNARRRDGTSFPIDLSVGESRIGDARVFTGFIRDLTERQQAELRLHDLQDELAHVSRVTAMGTLATSIAHELNQPLTAIANYVETASEMLASPDEETLATVREALDECARQAVRAGQIVRRLRDFVSRGETERQIVGLDRLINEASALAFVGTHGRPIEYQVELEAGAPLVLADRIQIQQVLLNLMRNAIQALADTPFPRLQVTSGYGGGGPSGEGMITVTVADNGPGLSAEIVERLFQPFLSTKAEGMGLGLSICRTIVEAHGGKIWANRSALGGAAFNFTLPEAGSDPDA
jgi:two-component system sensor kinase FixL